jgi:SAM-dependent methyltransferase
MSVRQLVPWWAKITAKLALSRLGIDYRRWQRWGCFVHGAMDQPAYALQVVRSHLARVGRAHLDGAVVLELGPGDSLATALIASALGAAAVYLVDAGDFAKVETAAYVELHSYLQGQGLRPPDVSRCSSRAEMLERCAASYLTDGLGDLRQMPSASVDLVFSQAVLEHVRLAEFDATQREIRRVLRPAGVSSHQVDLKDHLGGALNHLRFDAATWEAGWMASSGFYTNRLRYSEVLASMRAAGLAPEVTAVDRWSSLPTPRRWLAPHFREMSDEELMVKQFDCVARAAPEQSPVSGS